MGQTIIACTQRKIESYLHYTLCSNVDEYEREQPLEINLPFILYRTNTLLEPLEASQGMLKLPNLRYHTRKFWNH